MAAAIVVRLRSPLAAGVFAAGGDPLKLSWSVTGADAATTQVAYEVEAAPEPSFSGAWTTGAVESADQIAVPAPGPPLTSREVRYVRARIKTELGWSPWSDALRARGGTAPARRTGSPVRSRCPTTPGVDRGRRRRRCCGGRSRSTLRRAAARLYVTALGLHRVTLNGRPRLRRPARARLDRLPTPPPGGHVRRHGPAAPGRERDRRRRSATAGIAAGSATSPAATGATYGPEVGAHRPARGAPRRRLDARSSRRTTRGARPPARSDRPTCTTGARSTFASVGRAGTRLASTPRAGCRHERSRSTTPRIEPRLAPPVRIIGVLPTDAARARARPDRCSTAGRTSRATSG